MNKVDVWVIPHAKIVLLSELPGPPSCICGFVSQEAQEAAQKRGYATVSEIGFPRELYLGSFDLPVDGGWGEAEQVARAKAEELGYKVSYGEIPDDEDYFYDDDCDDDYFEEE